MKHLATNLTQQIITTTLVVCLSVCCCQGQILFDGMAGFDSEATAGCAAASCCVPSDLPNEGSDGPTRRCQSCCVKGTGLKDTLLRLPATTIAFLPPSSSATPIALPELSAPQTPMAVITCVDPPTLLRLHCALVV
jgi:hypothetical protein